MQMSPDAEERDRALTAPLTELYTAEELEIRLLLLDLLDLEELAEIARDPEEES